MAASLQNLVRWKWVVAILISQTKIPSSCFQYKYIRMVVDFPFRKLSKTYINTSNTSCQLRYILRMPIAWHWLSQIKYRIFNRTIQRNWVYQIQKFKPISLGYVESGFFFRVHMVTNKLQKEVKTDAQDQHPAEKGNRENLKLTEKMCDYHQ